MVNTPFVELKTKLNDEPSSVWRAVISVKLL